MERCNISSLGPNVELVNGDISSLPKFSYDDLPTDFSFRILQTLDIRTMRFALTTVSLDSPPPEFNALSYTWGSAYPYDNLTAEPNKPIILNGCVFYITENLWDALKTIHTGTRCLWVDALCINQQDLAERSAQVKKMGEIYSKAWQVVVWLGKTDWAAAAAIKIIEDFVPRFNQVEEKRNYSPFNLNTGLWNRIGREPFNDSEAKALTLFFERFWFERTWVIQEVFFAQSIVVICGLLKLEWDTLTTMSDFIFRSGLSYKWTVHRTPGSNDYFIRPVGAAPMSIDNLRRCCEVGIPVTESQRLPPLLKTPQEKVEEIFIRFLGFLIGATRLYQCTMAHDKVFAPAALALYQFSGRLKLDFFELDYTKSIAEVYTSVTRLVILHNRHLELLSWIEDKSFRTHNDLPSWVPDFSVARCSPLIALKRNFNCMKGCEVPCLISSYGRGLMTSGFMLDRITVIGPKHTTTAYSEHPYVPTRANLSTFSTSPTPWLKFLLELEETYVTGETSTIAFIRTIIADQKRDFDIVQLTAMFRAYLLHTLASSRDLDSILSDVHNALGSDESTDIVSLALNSFERWELYNFLDGFRARHNTIVPTIREVIDWINQVPGNDPGRHTEFVDISRKFFIEAHWSAIVGRRLCKSSQGYIGLMPESAKEGDEIWLIPGSKVPFVLRKLHPAGAYQFFGEAYVHGIMHGEWRRNNKQSVANSIILI